MTADAVEAADARRDTPVATVVKSEPKLPPLSSLPPNGDASSGGDTDDDDDVPLAKRFSVKRKKSPQREASTTPPPPASKRPKTEPTTPKSPKRKKEAKKEAKSEKKKKQKQQATSKAPQRKSAPAAPAAEVWRWWEEEKPTDGSKWRFLEHRGPVFAPPYQPLPAKVRFYYDGKALTLTPEAEEVAGFYARMLDHDYATKEAFNNNFFQDWRSVMSREEQKLIKSLQKCNFQEMHDYFKEQTELRKQRTKEEKQQLKEENEKLTNEFGHCTLDGHRQRVGNFRIEPPGLFRGRGNHPKMGKLKRRVMPEDVIINCSRDSKIPQAPAGRRWKEVRHDPSVSWLACWIENVQSNFKYVMLNAASRLKGEKDWKKYETARQLHKVVDRIRAQYRSDLKSKEMRLRQRAVALYFIDKLALRAGNEKDDDEADTVGCCSLRFEHIKLHKQHQLGEYVVEFDFLGKDSIRYNNAVPVEKRVFKNLRLFVDNKKAGDDLFDRLNTSILNAHLKELMDGLTAKVFRTYNASKTLEDQLEKLTSKSEPAAAKILSYNRANREVAILCNHQRAVPKTFEKSMENLNRKLEEKEAAVKAAKKAAKEAKSTAKREKSAKNKAAYEKKKAALKRMEEQLLKLKLQRTDKDENKEIALGTSKLNYLDPRISVAWCRRFDIPIEKVYNKTQREKFQWAIDMATAQFRFQDTDSDRATNNLKEEEEAEEAEADEE